MSTESRNPRSMSLDKMSAEEIVTLMNQEEHAVMSALEGAAMHLATAAKKAAEAFAFGGRIFYVGAGTSGRIATMDAAEMPPTFGIDNDRFISVFAGGTGAQSKATEQAEDDGSEAIEALTVLKLTKHDVVIGLAASGTTPFVIAGIQFAKSKGAWTCGIANNSNTPLLKVCDLGIFLDTGPEVLTGSTRLKAGTAQKLALNRISTTAMVLSGLVASNLMIGVKASNQKLRDRSVRIVCELTDLTSTEAQNSLEKHDWKISEVLESLT